MTPMTTSSAPRKAPSGEGPWADRRADARRNHERVLAAAIEVFTEHGLDATIPQVAERAGVGKATVYRSYPTKAALIEAIGQLHVDWLRGIVADAVHEAETDAFRALHGVIEAITTRLAQDRLMVEVLTRLEDWEPVPDGDEAEGNAERILELGRRQGTLREDVTMMDVKVLVGGMAHVLLELGIDDPSVWQRYTNLTLAALRR